MTRKDIEQLLQRVTVEVMGVRLNIHLREDQLFRNAEGNGRLYIQIGYRAPDTCSGGMPLAWSGRKWYLSSFMTADEIVKTAYSACRAAVEHEIMEGFKVDDQRVFNPHTPFDRLMEASMFEETRPIPQEDESR